MRRGARIAARRADIGLELGGALAPPLARAHGVRRSEVDALLERVRHVIPGLVAPDAPSGCLRAARPHHNLRPDCARGGPRVHFVDNVDPDSLGALFDVVDLRGAVVHVVSKSGSTVETAAGFQNDQPGVEAGKVAAFALLGRSGYEARRAEIERNRPPRRAL